MKKVLITTTALASTLFIPCSAEFMFKPSVSPTKPLSVVPIVRTPTNKPADPFADIRHLFIAPKAKVEDPICTCHKALHLYNEKKYSEAAATYKKAGDNMLAQYGHENTDVANMRYGEGLCYYMMSDYKKADSLFQTTIAIAQRVHKENTVMVARARTMFGDSQTRQGRAKEGERLINQALAQYKTLNKTKTEDYSDAQGRLAFAYDEQGKYEAAVPLYTEVASYKESTGAKRADITDVLKDLRKDLRSLKRFNDADAVDAKIMKLNQAPPVNHYEHHAPTA